MNKRKFRDKKVRKILRKSQPNFQYYVKKIEAQAKKKKNSYIKKRVFHIKTRVSLKYFVNYYQFYPILAHYYSTYWHVSNIKSAIFNANLYLCESLPTMSLLGSHIY